MSKVNNKFIRIEKKMKIEGSIKFLIEEGNEALDYFIETCEYLQSNEFKEAKLLGFGFFQYPNDPADTYRVFMHFEVYNLMKKYFENENFEDVSISITDLPNDFTKVEEVTKEVANASE